MSVTWIERAEKVIPGGVQTFSKARSQFPACAPTHIRRGKGAHVWSSDRREFIDWMAGLGAVSLGHGDPDVDLAVKHQLCRGTIFGLSHPVEVEFAEELCGILPWGEDSQVRYGKNGSDATSGALRAARAITGREHVLSQGYHGWHGEWVPNPNGVPHALRELTAQWDGRSSPISLKDVAAVIVEPDCVEELAFIRAACSEFGSLLIFDEVLTGFRVPELMWAKWKGVTPDLICFAKAIANGFPLSVIAGPRKYMEVFGGAIGYSFTFGGETLSLAAGLATVRKYKQEPVIERMWEVGGWVRDAWADATQKLGLDIPLVGYNSRLLPKYRSLPERTLFTQEMCKRGILMTTTFFPTYAHSDADVERTCKALRESLEVVASTDDPTTLVGGPIVAHPFRKMTE